MQVNVRVDTTELLKWASTLSGGKLRGAIKNGLNRAARAARTSAIEVIALDEGVSQARAKKSISKLSTASPSNLSASWTAGKQRIGILATSGATYSKGSGLNASTERLTGGGSARLNVKRAFVVNANGGRVLFIRKGPGRKNIRPLFAEMPSTGLGQANAAGRKVWEKTANVRLPQELNAALSAVLGGGSAPSDSGSND